MWKNGIASCIHILPFCMNNGDSSGRDASVEIMPSRVLFQVCRLLLTVAHYPSLAALSRWGGCGVPSKYCCSVGSNRLGARLVTGRRGGRDADCYLLLGYWFLPSVPLPGVLPGLDFLQSSFHRSPPFLDQDAIWHYTTATWHRRGDRHADT